MAARTTALRSSSVCAMALSSFPECLRTASLVLGDAARLPTNLATPHRVGRPTPPRMMGTRRGMVVSAPASSMTRRQSSSVSERGELREALSRARSNFSATSASRRSACCCTYVFCCGSSDERLSMRTTAMSGMYARTLVPAFLTTLTSWWMHVTRTSAAVCTMPSLRRKGTIIPSAAVATRSPLCSWSHSRPHRAETALLRLAPACLTVSLTSSIARRLIL
mmetsp:Transcript_35571/g.87490  ORF Transcript_35571/g.87490 Transcript_35571/m.87490 type:complete len:222 (-) Transcript_35571:790-1455(-)